MVSSAPAVLRAERVGELPAWRLSLPCGDTVLVAEHGAQVLSWQTAGRERFFLSPRSALDGSRSIRGGVPVCWPQFNQRGNGPKHGFARSLPWLITSYELNSHSASFELTLCSQTATRTLWPHEFELTLTVLLQPGRLRVTLLARNTGTQPWDFSGALHSYLACDDVQQATLSGLQGGTEWDALTDTRQVVSADLQFAAEFDRVYSGVVSPLSLTEGPHRLCIRHSPSWGNTVVWNPHASLCATLPDMATESWQRMLCVEAAQVFAPVTVMPGQHWQGWQEFERF